MGKGKEGMGEREGGKGRGRRGSVMGGWERTDP